jgi:Tol biopolymer transport system component
MNKVISLIGILAIITVAAGIIIVRNNTYAHRSTSTSKAVAPGKIAFAAKRDGHWNIYTIAPDGSDETQLSGFKTQDRFPVWSPDGSKIIYAGQRKDWSLFIMDADGGHLRPLTYLSNIVPKSPRSLSPDGRQIMFESDRDGHREIYSIQVDGTHLTKLTDNQVDDQSARWSPDGKHIVFTSLRDGNEEVYMMDADGQHQTRLTKNAAADRLPQWSPDGRRIAFVSDRDGNRELYVLTLSNEKLVRLTNDPADDDVPVWSPDGSRIAFRSKRDKNYDIEVVAVDDGRRTRLTQGEAYNGSLTWSPDGKEIAFISSRSGSDALYVMSAIGGAATPLTTYPVLDPVWSPN